MMLHAVMISASSHFISQYWSPPLLFICPFKILYMANLSHIENSEQIRHLSSKMFHTSYHIIKKY